MKMKARISEREYQRRLDGPSRLRLACPFCANKRLMHRSKWHSYSITSSARVSSVILRSGSLKPR
jgi:hypothetical protein